MLEDGHVKTRSDSVDPPQWPLDKEQGIYAAQEAALGSF